MKTSHLSMACATAAFVLIALATPDLGAQEVTSDESAQRRVLLIGDSHTQGAYGWALDYMLRAGVDKTSVATYAVCASSPISWIKGHKHRCGSLTRKESHTPDKKSPGLVGRGLKIGTQRAPVIMSLLRQHKPDTVVIALGENLKGMSPQRTRTSVSAMAKRLECYKRGVVTEDACRALDLATKSVEKELKCVWVLPHYSRSKGSPKSLERLYSTVKEGLGQTCQTIDSRPLTCKKGYEDSSFICDAPNYHLSPKRYRLWAIGTMEKLTEMLALPLVREGFIREIRTAWKFD